jgi:xanthine dehydrogenase small subunit
MNRDFVLIYLNGKRLEIRGRDCFLMMSDYLRYQKQMTGTKVVCAEGDCGACTCLRFSPLSAEQRFVSFNSCIMPVALLDGSHIITVEGIAEDSGLNPIQKAMVECNGSQCGFCTPGFVMSYCDLFERKPGKLQQTITEKNIKNALTGNLCRCTGYQSIIDAGSKIKKLATVSDRYRNPKIESELSSHLKKSVYIKHEDLIFYAPTTVKAATAFKAKNKNAMVFSAATDLGVPINKGKLKPKALLSLNLIADLYKSKFSKTTKSYMIGAKVTLTEIENTLGPQIPEFEKLLQVFASPQIKNSATLAGNVANGSPIGDTLPFLSVIGAWVHLQGQSSKRKIAFNKFYKGYRKPDIKTDEIITAIEIPIPEPEEILRLYKVSQRKDLDISVVSAGIRTVIKENKIIEFKFSLGGVAETVKPLPLTEKFLTQKLISDETIQKACQVLSKEIKPLSDLRGQSDYRNKLSQNFLIKFFKEIEHDRI